MIRLNKISHSYGDEQVLYDISLDVNQGELVFLSGESGSGKSTLLSIMSTLLESDKGEVVLCGETLDSIQSINLFRQKKIGFVFQFHYLIEYLNVYENLELAALEEKKKNIIPLLEGLGILDFLKRYPNQLSGGQRQRVALARALVNDPEIIFADEPTGSLDSKNSQIVYELFHEVAKKNTTVVIASHDMQVAEFADKTIRLIDGKIS